MVGIGSTCQKSYMVRISNNRCCLLMYESFVQEQRVPEQDHKSFDCRKKENGAPGDFLVFRKDYPCNSSSNTAEHVVVAWPISYRIFSVYCAKKNLVASLPRKIVESSPRCDEWVSVITSPY